MQILRSGIYNGGGCNEVSEIELQDMPAASGCLREYGDAILNVYLRTEETTYYIGGQKRHYERVGIFKLRKKVSTSAFANSTSKGEEASDLVRRLQRVEKVRLEAK
ncbi:hypothetical protein D3C76_1388480 [compost metagenome]